MDPLSNSPGSSIRPTRLKPASLGLNQTGDDKPKRLGIIGLDYRSNSKSGLTDTQGTFSHGAGETVTFSIGNLDLGATPGKPIATVVDLVEGATGVNNQRVANIARLLQSLDSDCNVRNGIQITSQIRAEVSPGSLISTSRPSLSARIL